ncbi:MAG: hypothetical protein P1U64_07895 [Alcanivoracaceae bacterium]|nr:hypothetical protein [Alcanivoracaceae bacterium]
MAEDYDHSFDWIPEALEQLLHDDILAALPPRVPWPGQQDRAEQPS